MHPFEPLSCLPYYGKSWYGNALLIFYVIKVKELIHLICPSLYPLPRKFRQFKFHAFSKIVTKVERDEPWTWSSQIEDCEFLFIWISSYSIRFDKSCKTYLDWCSYWCCCYCVARNIFLMASIYDVIKELVSIIWDNKSTKY